MGAACLSYGRLEYIFFFVSGATERDLENPIFPFSDDYGRVKFSNWEISSNLVTGRFPHLRKYKISSTSCAYPYKENQFWINFFMWKPPVTDLSSLKPGLKWNVKKRPKHIVKYGEKKNASFEGFGIPAFCKEEGLRCRGKSKVKPSGLRMIRYIVKVSDTCFKHVLLWWLVPCQNLVVGNRR